MEVVERPSLAQIFRRFYPRYRQACAVTREQRQAAWCLQACRTPRLGGREFACRKCGSRHPVYHSCRNRHCPLCQRAESHRWLERQEARLLPVGYFHVVFTVASELHLVFQYNRKLLYGLLLRVSAKVLQRFAADPQWLGAQLGMVGILHTWGQQLVFHPHAHWIVPQGGIDAQGRWVRPRRALDGKFLFPIGAVSRVFQGELLHQLEKLWQAGQLRFPDPPSAVGFGDRLRIAASKRWEVYAQRPLAGPEAILKYLGQYTHRIAIQEQRLLRMDADGVEFSYKDYRRGGERRTLKLPGSEMVRRFLEHVLPRGFRKIRQYGFLGNAVGREKLAEIQARWLAGMGALLAALRAWPETLARWAGEEPVWVRRCPQCPTGELVWIADVPARTEDTS